MIGNRIGKAHDEKHVDPSAATNTTYRADLADLGGVGARRHTRGPGHLIHRLQALAPDGHLLLVVVVVALLLAHEQLVTVARKVRGTLGYVLRVVQSGLGSCRVCL